MSLPTKTDLQTMDYAFQAQPFVNVPAKSTIDLTTMDYAYEAQPFVANPAAAAAAYIPRHSGTVGVLIF